MVALFEALGRFVNHMDRGALTSALVTLGLLVGVVLLVLFGQDALGLDQRSVQAALAGVAESPLALPAVIAVFCALALTGFPQALLIAGTVAVFGASRGIPFSWIATMASACLTYALGHAFGGRFVGRLSAGRAATMIRVFQARGALAAFLVRIIPSAPFVVVNAICGAAHVPLWKYGLGTGVGMLPKILFLALFTDRVDEMISFFRGHGAGGWAAVVGLMAAWVAFLLGARVIYHRVRRGSLAGLSRDLDDPV